MPLVTTTPFTVPAVEGWTFAGPPTFDTSYSAVPDISWATPSHLFFRDDGSKMYFTDPIGQNIWEYSLSTNWDPSTRGTGTGTSLAVGAAGGIEPQGLFIGNSGSTLFVCDSISQAVFSYTLSTPWLASSRSATPASQSVSIGTSGGEPVGMYMGGPTPGTRMYFADADTTAIKQYTLSTPWDITTAGSLVSTNVSVGCYAVAVDPTGTRLFFLENTFGGTDVAYQWSMSAWNLSTAVSNISFNPSGTNGAISMAWKYDDGTKMYLTNFFDGITRQYSTTA